MLVIELYCCENFGLLGEDGHVVYSGLWWAGGIQDCCILALFPKLSSRPKPDNVAA